MSTGTHAARLVPDGHHAWPEAMTVRAALRGRAIHEPSVQRTRAPTAGMSQSSPYRGAVVARPLHLLAMPTSARVAAIRRHQSLVADRVPRNNDGYSLRADNQHDGRRVRLR